MVNSEEKYYVSSFQECDNIIAQLKEKDSNNIDTISYVVKYEPEVKDFTDTETVVASLYVEKPKPQLPSAPGYSGGGYVATGANISYERIDLGISFINPVGGRTSSRFAELNRGLRSSYHTGLDIANPVGTPIAAAASGTIVHSGWKSAFGKMIVIDHGNGVQTYYAHCSSLYKSVGEYVNQGDIIAAVGMTGNVTGPHLHLEVRVNGVAYNPIYYFNY